MKIAIITSLAPGWQIAEIPAWLRHPDLRATIVDAVNDEGRAQFILAAVDPETLTRMIAELASTGEVRINSPRIFDDCRISAPFGRLRSLALVLDLTLVDSGIKVEQVPK